MTISERAFYHNFVVVTFAHMGVLLLIFSLAAMHGCRKQNAIPFGSIPIDLAMSVLPTTGAGKAPEKAAPPAPAPPKNVDSPKDSESPVVLARPKKLETPKKLPEKQEAKKPEPAVKKPSAPRPPPLTAKEIKDMLSKGLPTGGTPAFGSPLGNAPPGIPDVDAMYRAVIYQVYYQAWQQPSYADVGDAEAVVSIRLRLDGAVAEYSLSKKSGNGVLDNSVMHAVASVKDIPGLSPAFIKANELIPIAFKVEK